MAEKKVKTTLYLSEEHYRHAMELIRTGVAKDLRSLVEKLLDLDKYTGITGWSEGIFYYGPRRIGIITQETFTGILQSLEPEKQYNVGKDVGYKSRITMSFLAPPPEGVTLNSRDEASRLLLELSRRSGWGNFRIHSNILIIFNPLVAESEFMRGYLEGYLKGLIDGSLETMEAYPSRLTYKIPKFT
ncbi:MAG: hypothetical protein N3F04_07240 [Candidatus Nezhaarchaeota archaeon]|nr:hypothetical protein [Candidatus Nezhaarchaeota archaeon]MCX8142538.1 hypothetical protein [Candidatus Nezhaarchaeota archaeon]